MNEREIGEQAIKKYENGEAPQEIYQSPGRSKTWFFKWLKRSRLDGEDWAKDLTRRPHRISKRIDPAMEQAVVEARKYLEQKLYAQIGAFNISWHLRQKGINPPPIVTINKILKRNNLVRKRVKYEPKGIDYPL
jgi:putative transposase